MDRLKTFEDFDWKFGMGKKNIQPPREDDDLVDKIISKIENDPDPKKIRTGIVHFYTDGYIYSFPTYMVGVIGKEKSNIFSFVYVQNLNGYKNGKDFETRLDVSDEKVKELYNLIDNIILKDKADEARRKKEAYREKILKGVQEENLDPYNEEEW